MLDRSLLTPDRVARYLEDAEVIQYYRRNPCIACEDILGIKLIDAQKYILENSWNAQYVVWCCSRNFGKSFLGAIFMILKCVLYENQSIYIISSSGHQAKETFLKIFEIATKAGKTAASIASLKDILINETVKNNANLTGFSFAAQSYHVKFHNGSEIFTLNSKPDNNRSRRATMVFFDEAAFSTDELITVCEAFASQDMNFVTSTEDDYDPTMRPRKCPTQLVYASSQDGMDKLFYRHYKDYAKRMIAGDRNYFVCDMICDTAITTYMNGRPYTPLLTQEKVDAMMRADRDRALREYYNKPTMDGGTNQIIKWGTIRKNESFYLPVLKNTGKDKFIVAFDPARTNDNSIVSVMRLVQDPQKGTIGEIVGCYNFIDTRNNNKMKLDTNRQLAKLRELIAGYNGMEMDYENIDMVLIDAGAGGGGVNSYGDGLLNDWVDEKGNSHHGLIDSTHPLYQGYDRIYPRAIDKLRLIEPRKYRTQMVDEFIELMDSGVIQFPHEIDASGKVLMTEVSENGGEEKLTYYELSADEYASLSNIDIMKMEITSIYRHENAEKTAKSYALAKEKENKMHDDRFYTAILLAHRLYEIRRGSIVNKERPKKDYSKIFKVRSPRLY